MCDSSNSQLWRIPENFYTNFKLNKSSLNRQIDFPILKVQSCKMKEIMKILKKFCPDLINFENILNYSSNMDIKGIVFDPFKFPLIKQELKDSEVKLLSQLNFEITDNTTEYCSIPVSYDNYKLDILLKWILPNEIQLSGFTIVGHIVHVNLKEDLDKHKYAIGELMLDKIPRVKCVVSKLNTIDSEFRTFEFDLLAGQPDYITTVKENGLAFTFDFSKVYWNSRLGTEHERIVSTLQPKDIIYDACAGVGPFAIPALKKGCRVIANDLNIESCKWLTKNLELNSSKRNKLSIELHNLDACEFIRKIVLPDIIESVNACYEQRIFLIMNLPAIAVTFLYSLIDNSQLKLIEQKDVVLHVRCYCFIGKMISKEMIETKIRDQLGNRIDKLDLRFVRNVAPSKDMFCAEISVNLSKVCHEISPKRQKLESEYK